VPHLLLRYDPARVKIAPREVMAELRKGNPAIELNPSTGPNGLVVGVWMLQPGEEEIVARRLREVLTSASRA
jgi:hypothetical protein